MKHKFKVWDVPYRWKAAPIKNLRYVRSNIRNMYARGRYGWSGTDIYGLDSYISYILRDGIHWWLTEANGGVGPMGYPSVPQSSFQALVFDQDERETSPGYKQWCKTLADIADGFGAALDIMELNYDFNDPAKLNELQNKMEAGLDLFKNNLLSLWD